MVHMPSLPDTPENRNGSDNVLVNTPYCSTSQYKCADKQLDYLVSADNSGLFSFQIPKLLNQISHIIQFSSNKNS